MQPVPGAGRAPRGGAGSHRSNRFDQVAPQEVFAAGLAWARQAFGGATVANARLLTGGMTGIVLAIDAPEFAPRRFVLKLYTPDPAEPDSASREARILNVLQTSGLPVPRVVAMDREGAVAGWPALLMTRLPGRQRFRPRDLQPWLEGLARLAARIHALKIPLDSLPRYRPWGLEEPLERPVWWTNAGVWSAAVEVFRGPAPKEPRRFIHRDFHPGNVLWKDRRPSAIVDWLHGCSGPVAVDVAHCRLNLWLDNGHAAADAWLDAYRAANPEALDLHPYWDISDALSWVPDHAGAIRRARRYEAFVTAAVARL